MWPVLLAVVHHADAASAIRVGVASAAAAVTATVDAVIQEADVVPFADDAVAVAESVWEHRFGTRVRKLCQIWYRLEVVAAEAVALSLADWALASAVAVVDPFSTFSLSHST